MSKNIISDLDKTNNLGLVDTGAGRRVVNNIVIFFSETKHLLKLFVCVEVLRPSQPNGVMSSAVSLPNHIFTGQA